MFANAAVRIVKVEGEWRQLFWRADVTVCQGRPEAVHLNLQNFCSCALPRRKQQSRLDIHHTTGRRPVQAIDKAA